MRSFDLHGPFGLQFNVQTQLPGKISVMYNHPDDMLLERTRSEPLVESSQADTTQFARRTQSEVLIDIPAPSYPGPEELAQMLPASAPSPAPTEIIPIDLTQEECVEDIQRQGIKVRDFAYEPVPVETRAPELFDPLLAWSQYEAALTHPNPNRTAMLGRTIRRLLDLGWVTVDDQEKWLEQDRDALADHDSRPTYPWRAFKVDKPEKDVLAEVARNRFRELNADQLLPAFIKGGIAKLAGALGRRDNDGQEKKRTADESATPDKEEAGDVSPRLKKRKLSNAASNKPVPAAPPTLPVIPVLVNGRPPKQYPAGNPADGTYPPSRPNVMASARPLVRNGQASSNFKPPEFFLRRGAPSTQPARGADESSTPDS
ncbi:hypothetical protein BV22DRAFT_710684 [Leucogyrophana mollusca]|uniref:Uncharacterized protein n=1 Tax=Leucogyrophana mollusca TaxID=85980 RepID=A0ACB8B9Y2_9AGAM|nr:hypothetical protein BV22DRAFT_710684 [Leucogyrophana mollusca]